jgi:membrane-bound lytic murein transglycosylase B
MLPVLAVAAVLATPAPATPAATAAALARDTLQLRAAVAAWRRAGSERQPQALLRIGLRQQRRYLALGVARRAYGDAVVRALPRQLRRDAHDIVRARRSLVALTSPTTKPLSSFRVGPAEPVDRLLAHYREAEHRFGVPWNVLAAVNFVETAFGKVRSSSLAGAQGPMQFLPGTWRAYGLGGDVHDPRDAILGAANLLRASGAPQDLRRALYAYNHSPLYVEAVLAYARVLGRTRAALPVFHAWRVFVRAPDGYRLVGR